MLREIDHVQQVPNDYFRRWFADENLDLIVWHKPDQTIYGFQLCYDRYWRHRALTWTEKRGFSHDNIDDGEASPLANRSPTLNLDDSFDAVAVLARFRKSARQVPIQTRIFVREKIREYSAKKGVSPWIYPLLGLSAGFFAGIGFFAVWATFSERRREKPPQADPPR